MFGRSGVRPTFEFSGMQQEAPVVRPSVVRDARTMSEDHLQGPSAVESLLGQDSVFDSGLGIIEELPRSAENMSCCLDNASHCAAVEYILVRWGEAGLGHPPGGPPPARAPLQPRAARAQPAAYVHQTVAATTAGLACKFEPTLQRNESSSLLHQLRRMHAADPYLLQAIRCTLTHACVRMRVLECKLVVVMANGKIGGRRGGGGGDLEERYHNRLPRKPLAVHVQLLVDAELRSV